MIPENLTPEFILSEVKKLQYLYGLKWEIRYGQTRPVGDLTESVAEHIYGMHLLAHYFLPLENPENTWDRLRIFSMITMHDLDELETGDTIGYLKTDDVRDMEREAKIEVINKSPNHLQNHFLEIIEEYEAQETSESKFVKAIDRFEPLIQVYSEFGLSVINLNKTTADQSRRIKDAYIQFFPIMDKFNQTIQEAMIQEGFFNHDKA